MSVNLSELFPPSGGSSGGGYDDTQIRDDLAKETQDRIDGDQALQDQVDSLPVTVSAVEPHAHKEGSLWFNPDTGKMYVYASGAWTEFGDSSSGGGGGPGGGGVSAVLVVGGGGEGGGVYAGGGGGGGGVVYQEADLETDVTYQIIIGEGGNSGDPNNPREGNSSVFRNFAGGSPNHIEVLATGGGHGASHGMSNTGNPLMNGGCGGGAGYQANTYPGTGIADQGFDGGAQSLVPGLGSGGGGAGEEGYQVQSGEAEGGKGGDGKMSDITGFPVYYGGGGGGGRQLGYGEGGQGGLGGGGSYVTGSGAGTDGLGGGGAGCITNNAAGGRGGHGVVIVSTPLILSQGVADDVLKNGDMNVYVFERGQQIQFATVKYKTMTEEELKLMNGD